MGPRRRPAGLLLARQVQAASRPRRKLPEPRHHGAGGRAHRDRRPCPACRAARSAPAEDEQSCRKALARAERRLRRLYELYAEDEDDTLRDAIARAKQDRDRASEALLAAQQRAGQDAEKEDALGALRTVGAQWDSLDAREKQSLVRACVDRIVLRNDRIEIFYAIEGAERSEVRAG